MNLEMQSASLEVTPEERQQALDYLAETRDGVVQALHGLSEAQWNFKTAPDRWSLAELLEHLAVVENRVQHILRQIREAPAAPPDPDRQRMHIVIRQRGLDRSTTFQAPPAILPTGRWTTSQSLEEFLNAAEAIAARLDSPTELRRSLLPHPVLGALDGYEWILLTAAHNERHLKQIEEVKADPNFPPN